MNAPIPVSLKGDGDGVTIAWSDAVAHRLSWRFLRDNCPCATCIAQRREPAAPTAGLLPVLSPQEAQPLKVLAMKPIGNYAYAIHFNDGHTTGIYSFPYLRELGEVERGIA